MKMFINGEWTDSSLSMPIVSPYSREVVDTVPVASLEQIELALGAAVHGAAAMGKLTAAERFRILIRAADLVAQELEDLARTISLEEGKPITESRAEAGRMPDMIRLCAFEGSQLRGEVLPIDAQAGVTGKLAFTLREPCGIVVAITPFNYPLLLVLHKVGPALAAGNAVILKPAGQTPLVALKLTRILIEAGIPENGIQCITGKGSTMGDALCSDPRVRKISFTGSSEVGEKITQVAGIKRLSLELGSNSPLVVLSDADVDEASAATAVGGYVNAGQVCISTQRVLVARSIYADYLDALKPRVESLTVGDPLNETTKVSAMISEREAQRVELWVGEALADGARVLTGGQRSGAVFQPTVVADVRPAMRISCQELFGPAVAVTPVEGIDEAIAMANDSEFGLGAGVFTRDVSKALRFARQVHSGTVQINSSSLWRADLMPYGGYKQSGIGKEGPRYAIEEMTELKTVVIHGLDS